MMLNTRGLFSNQQLSQICLYSAIILVILGIVDGTIQLLNYWSTFQYALSPIYGGSLSGQGYMFSFNAFNSISNLFTMICSFFFFASAFAIASIVFKRYAPGQVAQGETSQPEQSTQDGDDYFELEIIDLPPSSRH